MSEVDEIKGKLDVVDFIGNTVPLKKAGRNYKGLCPFHSEKTPSFMVSPDKQIWHCFGCGKGGDIFGFLMEKEGLSFGEAIVQLAERAGVELKSRPKDWGERNKLVAINELATKFFEKSLAESKEGRKAYNYLIDRGINKQTVATFRLGYAPSGWEYLVKFLSRRDYQPVDIEKAGLAVKRSRGYSDKFRNRLMFPISDASGRVVGFTGRVLSAQDQPKYLNSPETQIFSKSRILYGLNIAKEEIQKLGVAVVVEGQMDVLASHQAGIKNVVASSGTALTAEQMRLIRRYTEVAILALDADSAGSDATKRAIELASAEDLEVKVAVLGEYKDPDECIKAGPDKWKEILDSAVPAVEFYIQNAVKRFGSDSVSAKKKIAGEVLPIISILDSPVEKDQYIKRLASQLSVEPRSLYEALAKPKRNKPQGATGPRGDGTVDKSKDPNWLPKRILGIMLYRPDYWPKLQDEIEGLDWGSDRLAAIYSHFKDCYTGKEFSLDSVIDKLDYRDRVDLLELMMVIEENYADMPEMEIGNELKFYINLLKQRAVRKQMAELSQKISEAEKSGNAEELQGLLEKFKNFK